MIHREYNVHNYNGSTKEDTADRKHFLAFLHTSVHRALFSILLFSLSLPPILFTWPLSMFYTEFSGLEQLHATSLPVNPYFFLYHKLSLPFSHIRINTATWEGARQLLLFSQYVCWVLLMKTPQGSMKYFKKTSSGPL